VIFFRPKDLVQSRKETKTPHFKPPLFNTDYNKHATGNPQKHICSLNIVCQKRGGWGWVFLCVGAGFYIYAGVLTCYIIINGSPATRVRECGMYLDSINGSPLRGSGEVRGDLFGFINISPLTRFRSHGIFPKLINRSLALRVRV